MSTDTKALLIALRVIAESRYAARHYAGCMRWSDVASTVADRLAALRSAEGWVKCSERLPEQEQYPVLIAHRSGAIRLAFGIAPLGEEWMGYYEPALRGRVIRGLTHW